MTKIGVAELGYVGLSNAVLLAQRNDVVAYEISLDRVDQVNDRQCPIVDAELEDFLAHKQLRLCATTDPAVAFKEANFIIVATPTNYLNAFKADADLIVANRLTDDIRDVEAKVFTRDLFGSDA